MEKYTSSSPYFYKGRKSLQTLQKPVLLLLALLLVILTASAQRLSSTSSENLLVKLSRTDKPNSFTSSGGINTGKATVNYTLTATERAMPPASADIDQIRNGDADGPFSGTAWVNGNAGASNAHYAEGWSIAYRMRLNNLPAGNHTIIIEWDTRHSSKMAIDFITHFQNLDDFPGSHQATFGHTQEIINPVFGTAFNGQAPAYADIPRPQGLSNGANATFTRLESAGKEKMAIWGAAFSTTDPALEYDVQQALSAAQTSTSLIIRIVTTGNSSNVVLAWGGHIASKFDWGEGNSASAVSGSPYHTRLLSLDGSGGNQDRSLSAAAVVAPPPPCPVLTPNPARACPEASNIVYNYTPEAGVTYVWTLTNDATASAGATIQSVDLVNGVITVVPSGTDFLENGKFSLNAVLTRPGAQSQSCPFTDIGLINDIPDAPDVTYNAPNCDEDKFTVTVNDPIVGASYSIKDKNGAAISGVTVSATMPYASGPLVFGNIPAGAGYQVTVTVNGCTSSAATCQPSSARIGGGIRRTQQSTDFTIELKAPEPTATAVPNPFNDRIRFTLKSEVSGQGTLELYNMMGQRMKVVYQGQVEAGQIKSIDYSVPFVQRQNLIYVFRVGSQKVSGKLLGMK